MATTPNLASAKAIFAGGCFWCLEPAFAQLKGTQDLKVGYTGGHLANPSYEQVSAGQTGHYEAIQVTYDPTKMDYQELLDTFWRQIDPTDSGGQFADRGDSYKTAIFYSSEAEKKLAEVSKKQMDESGIFSGPIVTKILPANPFYEAEEYHQEYYKKSADHYQLYSWGSGRKPFLEKTWKES